MDDFMQWSEHETVTIRGRAPAHEVYLFQNTLLDLLMNKRKKQLLRRKMGVKGLKVNVNNKSSIELCLFNFLIVIIASVTRTAARRTKIKP